jgi:hypothetical protein
LKTNPIHELVPKLKGVNPDEALGAEVEAAVAALPLGKLGYGEKSLC